MAHNPNQAQMNSGEFCKQKATSSPGLRPSSRKYPAYWQALVCSPLQVCVPSRDQIASAVGYLRTDSSRNLKQDRLLALANDEGSVGQLTGVGKKEGRWRKTFLPALIVSRSDLLSTHSCLMSFWRCSLASRYAAAAVVPAATAAVVAAMQATCQLPVSLDWGRYGSTYGHGTKIRTCMKSMTIAV